MTTPEPRPSELVERLEHQAANIRPIPPASLTDAAAEIRRLSGLVEALKAHVTELADDHEAELNGRYERMLDYPAMKMRYDRDMASVSAARATLAEMGEG